MLAPLSLLLVGTLVQPPAGTMETVRGRVTGDSARAVVGAQVLVTRGEDRLVQSAVTSSSGEYVVTFERGTGDYLVFVAAPEYRSARRRVQAVGGERVLRADFTLGPSASRLATMRVVATRPARPTDRVTATRPEPGTLEDWASGVRGQVDPLSAGDVLAGAAVLPGTVATEQGLRFLGAESGSNLTTVNGLAVSGDALPRAALTPPNRPTDLRITGATFDATRGGFAGANIDLQIPAGDRNQQHRLLYFTAQPPVTTADRRTSALGGRPATARLSLGADGEAIRHALTYNMALDVSRSATATTTLQSTTTPAWNALGVADGRAARLLALSRGLGIPLASATTPGTAYTEAFSYLGRFDDVRDSVRALSLTTLASGRRVDGIGWSPFVAPSAGAQLRQSSATVQADYRTYVGPSRRVLLKQRASLSRQQLTVRPYSALPGGVVFAPALALTDRDDVGATFQVGGGSGSRDERGWTGEATTDVAWFARGTRHRFKGQWWMRIDAQEQRGGGNGAGLFTYATPDDFASGRVASYVRQLPAGPRQATTLNAAASVAHVWAPSRTLSIMSGARAEFNGLVSRVEGNASDASVPGVRASSDRPALVHLSPRLGFQYTVSQRPDDAAGFVVTGLGRFLRQPVGVIRGGIGEFRDLLLPGALIDADLSRAGNPDPVSLACIGSAAPSADWTRIVAGLDPAPTSCLDGTGPLGIRAPSRVVLDPAYDVPRNWRAALGWTSRVRSTTLRLDGLASYGLSYPSIIDANFAGLPRFTLSDEGARPVFVGIAGIDARNGFVSTQDSRVTPALGMVTVRRSDLRARAGQITVTVAPDLIKVRGNGRVYGSTSYTLQGAQAQRRGFDGTTAGDPRALAWLASSADARHTLTVQAGLTAGRLGTMTLFARLQSGLPYTPIVDRDINGDGRSNDRAFVPRFDARALLTGGTPGSPTLAEALSPAARRCLVDQQNTVARAQSCRAPWTSSLLLNIRPPSWRTGGARFTPTITVQNPLAGLDGLLHGADQRGWGSARYPDPVLLRVRAFDATRRAFAYEVNRSFGSTASTRSPTLNPFRVTMDVAVDFSVPGAVQSLRRALEPIRVEGRDRPVSPDTIAARKLLVAGSIFRLALAESDTLFLSRQQTDALVQADSLYWSAARGIVDAYAQWLYARRASGISSMAVDSSEAVDQRLLALSWTQVDIIEPLLDPLQRQAFPRLQQMLAVPRSDRAGTFFFLGTSLPYVYRRPAVESRP